MDENEKRRIELKSDLGIMKIIAQAKEFENIKVRPEEMEELENLIKKTLDFRGITGNIS